MPPNRRLSIDVEEIKHLAFLFIMFIACWWLDEIIFDLIPVRKRHITTCTRNFCKKSIGFAEPSEIDDGYKFSTKTILS